ncbi:hypothetical protein [Streptomyces tendae]|uniref:hypothetical protein n=1 Tax=Streptomyces tendae TaxID=1932 RepID=UPI00342EBB07
MSAATEHTAEPAAPVALILQACQDGTVHSALQAAALLVERGYAGEAAVVRCEARAIPHMSAQHAASFLHDLHLELAAGPAEEPTGGEA